MLSHTTLNLRSKCFSLRFVISLKRCKLTKIMVRPKKPSAEETFVLSAPNIGLNVSTPLAPIAPPSLNSSIPPIRRKNPPTIKIVVEAIKNLEDKKGCSYVAIKNWTLANYPEVNRNKLKFMLSKALEKGVKDGTFRHLTAGSGQDSWTVGRYKIENVKPKVNKRQALSNKTNKFSKEKVVKQKAETEEPETVSDTEIEATKPLKAATQRRRSRSESDFETVKKAPTGKKTAPKKIRPIKETDSETAAIKKKSNTAAIKTKLTSTVTTKKTAVPKKKPATKKKLASTALLTLSSDEENIEQK